MFKKMRLGAAALFASLMTFGLSAFAALDPAVDTTITAVQTDGVSMVAKGYGLAGAIVGAMILLGLFIKVVKKTGRG